jgi:hypothetical protein
MQQQSILETSKSRGLKNEKLKDIRQSQRSTSINWYYLFIYNKIADQIFIGLLEVHRHDC